MPASTTEQQQLQILKQQMRKLAYDYTRNLSNLDAHSLIQGLQDTRLEFLPLGDREGMYDPVHRMIIINSSVQPTRQRFTLAHEISHALLYQDEDLLCDLHDFFEGERLEQVIEVLCNVGAAAILVRPELLSELISSFGHSGRTLALLMKRADISASVAMQILCETAQKPLMYAICASARQAKGQPNSSQSDTVAIVRASRNSRGLNYSLAAGSAIPQKHPVGDALIMSGEVQRQSYIPFRSGKKMPAWVAAFAMNTRTVTACFIP